MQPAAECIANQGRRPLPDQPYVNLTEAATWIVEGDCLDDDYLIRRERAAAWLNRRRWHSMAGPAWLLPWLDLIRKGETPKDPFDFLNVNQGEKVRAKIARGEILSPDEQRTYDDAIPSSEKLAAAKRWLDKTERDPKKAYEEVKADVARLNEIECGYERFYQILQKECSAGRIVLLGIEYHKGECVSGKHVEVPHDFFLRAFDHWRGGGPSHKGEFGPAILCAIGGTNVLVEREDILNGNDKRSTFAEVLLRRDDVLELKPLYDGSGNSDGADSNRPRANLPVRGQALLSNVREWYREDWVKEGSHAEWLKRKGRPSGTTPSEKDDLDAARETCGRGVSRDMIRRLRKEFAPQEWTLSGRRKL